MKKLFIIFLFLAILVPVLTLAQESKKKAIYFYSETCPRCQTVEKYFQENGIYEKYEIQKLDTHQSENFEKLNAIFSAYGIEESKRGVPAIFFGRRFFAGDIPIIKRFSDTIENTQADFFPSAEKLISLTEAQKAEARKQKKYIAEIPFKLVIGAAFLDILNPFSWVVLIFLLWLLLFARTKRKMLIFGIIFSVAVFTSHLFLGFLFYNFPRNYFWQQYILIIVMVGTFIFGLACLKGVIWSKKRSRITAHRKIYHLNIWWRGFKEKINQQVMTKKSFLILGFLASLFFWAYDNEPYKAILDSLKEENNFLKTGSLILAYNVFFTIPFLIISLLAERFSRTKKMDLFGDRFFNLIKIFLGVIMLFIGAYLALNLIN